MAATFPRAGAPYAVLAALVCVSRIYVGDHWPSDVLAGAALGLAMGFLGRKALSRLETTVLRRGRSPASEARTPVSARGKDPGGEAPSAVP
jgi:undecaprenyl-diphosphatase